MSPTNSNVLLVTENYLMRECLASALRANSDLTLEVVDDLAKAEPACKESSYVVAVFDIDPPNLVPESHIRQFTQRFPSVSTIVFGRCRDESEVIQYLEAGAVDFRVTDTESLDGFCEAVENARLGQIHHGSERARALFARLRELSAEVSRIRSIDTMVLTDREMEILRLLDEGQSNKQIAKALHISLHTVKNHVHRILEKLQVTNRREAVHLAYNNGWLKVQA